MVKLPPSLIVMFLPVDVSAGPVLFRLNSRSLPRSKDTVGLGPGFIAADVGLLPFQPSYFMPSQFSVSNALTNSVLLIPLPLIDGCRFGKRQASCQKYTG
jgi:hypothetical protein